jgi:hypothetical protein
MNEGPYELARTVEARGMAILLPFLRERSDGQFVLFEKGSLARALQETLGDAVLRAKDGSARSAEVKIENTHTGNLFLEVWSNRNLEVREEHIRFGSNVGWLYKSVADLLLYYFLEVDRLYVIDLFRLQQWAFKSTNNIGRPGRIWDYPEVPQGKYRQRNETIGRLVPLSVISSEVGYRLFNPKQLPLFPENEENVA